MLEGHGTVNKISKGKIIFNEGDSGQEMYFIRTGKIRIFRKRPEGDVSLTVLESNDFFGEMSLFTNQPRSASAQAIEDTELVIVDKPTFLSFIKEPVVLTILEEMSSRIREIDDKIEELSIKEHIRHEHLSSLATSRKWFV